MKFKTSLFAVLITCSLLMTPKPANAALLFSGKPIGLLGLVAIPAGAGIAYPGTRLISSGNLFKIVLGIPLVFIGMQLMGGGIVLLDAENEIEMEFKPLNYSAMQELGINAEMLQRYNSEIDQANILLDEVHVELEKMDTPTTEDAKEIWQSYEGYVSAETMITMQKIVNKALKSK